MSDSDNISVIGSTISFGTDLSEVEPLEPLPPGKYVGAIRSVESKKSSNGNPYLEIRFVVSSDQYPMDYEGDDEGTLLIHRMMLTNRRNNLVAMRRFCEAIGAPLSNKIDTNDFIGRSAVLDVANEVSDYDGQPRAVIRRVLNETA